MDFLKSIIFKFSKYELFNRLLPGVFFVLLSKVLKCPMLKPDNWVETFGVYIFWGELSSRIGALFIEPFLKITKFVRFVEYSDYQDYQRENKEYSDKLIANANFARTLCAHGLLLEVMRLWVLLPNCKHIACVSFGWLDIAVFALTILFLFAYCRQVNFLVDRIEKFKKDRVGGATL